MDYSVVKKPAVYWSLIGVAVVVIVVLVVALSGSSGPERVAAPPLPRHRSVLTPHSSRPSSPRYR